MFVRFENTDVARKFVDDVNTLPFDVNISEGSRIFDAKSLIAVMNLDFSKKFLVTPIIENKLSQITAFNDTLRKYEYKEGDA